LKLKAQKKEYPLEIKEVKNELFHMSLISKVIQQEELNLKLELLRELQVIKYEVEKVEF
jgi:hypothetical protein